jgi:uncharacterized protein (DUF58 family)
VAGARPYRPGDRRAWIDWRASARLSAARSEDQFVVREFFADQAPRVVLVVDRRARMGLYASPFPWLDKPAAVDGVVRLVLASTAAERGDVGYVEHVRGRTRWLAPRGPSDLEAVLARRPHAETFDAGAHSLEASLAELGRHASLLPAGTFVFVVSDFVDAVGATAWARLRAHHWDVTPVIVQDPTWEQSFPDVGGVLLPVLDPASGRIDEVWLRPGEAGRRAEQNARRLEELVTSLRRFGFDPIVLGSSDDGDIASAFGRWAERRLRVRRRSA